MIGGMVRRNPVSDESTMDAIDWQQLLQESRSKRQQLTDAFDGLWEEKRPLVQSQLNRYAETLVTRRQTPPDTPSGGNPRDRGDILALVRDTRCTLRFGLCCLSLESGVRRLRQNEAWVCGWWEPLLVILSEPKGDAKCRMLAAQTLNNLITLNSETAGALLRILPVEEPVSLKGSLRLSTLGDGSVRQASTCCWVDILVCAVHSGSREAFAAIVAALHNCIVSLEEEVSKSRRPLEAARFVEVVSSSPLLVSTLLRQLLPLGSFYSTRELQTNEDHMDSATELIVIFFSRLFRAGMLSRMYLAEGGSRAGGPLRTIVPEQVALLFCLWSEMEQSPSVQSSQSLAFGGIANADSVVESFVFLATIFCELDEADSVDTMQIDLQHSMQLTILEIFAEALSADSPEAGLVRQGIAHLTAFVKAVSFYLARVFDSVVSSNQGKKSCDAVLPDREKRMLMTSLRVLGNLCYQCVFHQDLMRTTIVPRPGGPEPKASCERSALHVLLSCTSLSHASLGLREWSIVAIRNALDGNLPNQEAVAQLQAVKAVQSTELDQMGLRVALDSRGEVSVTGLGRIPEDIDEQQPQSCL